MSWEQNIEGKPKMGIAQDKDPGEVKPVYTCVEGRQNKLKEISMMKSGQLNEANEQLDQMYRVYCKLPMKLEPVS